jgi:hypothetical protein
VLLATGIYAGGWWHGKNSAAGPAQRAAHAAAAQLPPPSAPPPGYLTSKAPPAPPAAGAEALAKLLEQRAKPEDLATALAAWAEQDPDAAFRALLADPRLQLPETARALFEVLGKNNPTQALQRLAQLPALPWAREANKGLATGWTQRDPKAATTAGLALPPDSRRTDFLSTAFSQWLSQDIPAAHAWIFALSPVESRARFLSSDTFKNVKAHNAQEMSALREINLLTTDFQDANNLLGSVVYNLFTSSFTQPFQHWVSESPDAALQWVLSLPPDDGAVHNLFSVALKPFSSDPARVLALLPQIKSESGCQTLLTLAAKDWSARNPVEGWAWAAQLQDPAQHDTFAKELCETWTTEDPGTAIPWLYKNQPDDLRIIHSDFIHDWAVKDPETALTLLGKLPANDPRRNFSEDLLRGIAATQPTSALSHLDLLNNSQERRSVMYQAMSSWSAQDLTSASSYTDALAPGEERQSAICGILNATFKESPESALTWAATLTDPGSKKSWLGTLMTNWRKKDPTAAQNWLDNAPLDDALRQKLTPSQP